MQPTIDVTHVTPEVADDEEITPTTTVFEAAAPMAEEVVPSSYPWPSQGAVRTFRFTPTHGR